MANRHLQLLRRRLGLTEVAVRHESHRIRHEMRPRWMIVERVERLSPGMLRIVFGGADLADFTTYAPDDHVKLFFPTEAGGTVKRDYTPRKFDRSGQRLTIDFALHETGPATRWAVGARVGDRIESAGPKTSVVIPQDFDWWLLVGEEASLPAISRRIEELRPEVPVTAIIAVTGPAEECLLTPRPNLHIVWVHRPLSQADDAMPVIKQLRRLPSREGEGFVWIGGESGVARALRSEVVERAGHPRQWVKARGYWKKGVAGTHDKIED